MSKQPFDRKLEAIDELRTADAEVATKSLAKALKDKSNYAVSKAAHIAAERSFQQLLPDLLAAFERFFHDPVKTDPQCWAKNAISKALRDLGHTDADTYLRGIAHVQLEGVWGGSEDTAATLRGTCALALVQCPLHSSAILLHLVDLLDDGALSVRIDAIRAMGQLASHEAVLPLRVMAMFGGAEPEVTGWCFTVLLDLASRESMPFVVRYLRGENADLRMEAAGALASCHDQAAVEHLQTFWRSQVDRRTKPVFLQLLSASPLPGVAELLVEAVGTETPPIAMVALEALAKSRFHEQLREQVKEAVEKRNDAELAREFMSKFEQ